VELNLVFIELLIFENFYKCIYSSIVQMALSIGIESKFLKLEIACKHKMGLFLFHMYNIYNLL